MSGYTAACRNISDLSEHDLEAMQLLYLSHYDGCTPDQFQCDLLNKQQAILVFHEELVGFTTLQVYEQKWQDQRIRIVYSGDTVVDRAHWGQQALAFTWIAKMGELHRQDPATPLYWFLIVKGHRTYKYLPAFARSFYPHWSEERSDLKSLADDLAQEKFGRDYNPASGVVEFTESRGHLKPDIALPDHNEQSKNAVRFFLERNPNYLRGHELVCLCELGEHNMKPFTRRIFLKGLA